MTSSETLLHLRKAFPLSWRMRRRCRLPSGRFGEPFFMSFDPGGGIYGEQWNSFDDGGVLFKGVYNPVSIAQYALYCYERLCEGDAGAREPFLKQAQYLCRAQRADGTYSYAYEHSGYGVPAGWISGLSQGEAFAVFLRAYALTGDAEYADRARGALSAFERDVSAGGAAFLRGNDVFFEEMPARATHILNGHVFAAFSVWEAIRYGFASRSLADLHKTAIETLVRWLPHYDEDGWSYYELAVRGNETRHYVPITYHQTHICVLRVYAAMTGRSEFADMAGKWRRGLDRWDVRARVWRDSAQWVADAALRRLYKTPSGTWRSLLPESG